MKRKFIIIGVLAVAAVAALGAAFWLKPEEREVQIEGTPIQQDRLELICMAETEEEAEKLAADYEIELISYSEKVAVFQTNKTYEEILETGKVKGLTELSLNNEMKAY